MGLSKAVKDLRQNQNAKSYIQVISKITHPKIFTVLPEAQDIIDVKIGAPGPTADINIFREIQEQFKEDQKFKGDKAFIGGNNISTPHKKPRNKELSEIENSENKEFSSQRVFVEHVIRLIKIFKVCEHKFRLRSRHYDLAIGTVCGLVRLRIQALIL